MARATLEFSLPRFRDNYDRIRDEVTQRAQSAGHNTPEIVVVTKYFEAAPCAELLAAGYGPLGENRAQELAGKQAAVSSEAKDWHFIGHLQRNKVVPVLRSVSCFHALDSERLAAAIVRQAETAECRCLVQVNVSGETSKGGLPGDQALELVTSWAERWPQLRLVGLMTMAPRAAAQECRPIFRRLRELREQIRERWQQSPELSARATEFCELSMGMSNDYGVAVEEGATVIRLGRVLFE